jgi:hypothetical protein
MTSEMVMTANDFELLDALTHKVRVAKIAQIGRWLWKGVKRPEVSARTRLRALEAHGFVTCFYAEAHPEISLPAPIISWQRGAAPPDFSGASYRLQNRWTRPAVSTACVIATAQAGRLFGGYGGRFPRESEETHDIHVAAVYFRLCEENRDAARHWISEELIRQRRGYQGEKLPDALIDRPGDRKVVEFGGAYKKDKLERFHNYCAELELSYEVW